MSKTSRIMAAACATAAALALAAPALAGSSGAYHIYATPEYQALTGRVPNLGTTGQMEYFGGSVFSKVNVVSVMWGSNVNAQTVSTMPGYFKAIVNSTFLDQLTEYSTKGVVAVNGHTSTNQVIHRGTFTGQVVITPQNQNTNLTDKDIHVELKYQISIGALPPQNRNMLYMIFFPSNVTINLDGQLSCQAFGAYHFATNDKKLAKKTNIFYGVMPDCGYNLQSHEIIAAHEFAEATTDNVPTPGSNPNFPQAWNTSDGYEIGDLCEGTSGQLVTRRTTYYVQQVYLNSLSGCSTGNYKSP